MMTTNVSVEQYVYKTAGDDCSLWEQINSNITELYNNKKSHNIHHQKNPNLNP